MEIKQFMRQRRVFVMKKKGAWLNNFVNDSDHEHNTKIQSQVLCNDDSILI